MKDNMKLSIILLTIFFNLSIYNFLYKSYLFIFLYVIVLIVLISMGFVYLYNKYIEQKEKEQKQILLKSKEYEKEISLIYNKNFKESEYEDLFDKNIFTIISLVNDLTEENLRGIFKSRVQELVNKSLQLYLINVKQAERIKKASNVGLDLKKDLEEVLNQNKSVMVNLKDFIMKLIMLQENSDEFNELIKTFENSIKTLGVLKNKKEFK